ncbi:MAG: FkbM family methyltransferase [Pseudomonadota bacterium]|nr:FkbM family methyltransferase [Pseudomonadota bacterium]
MRLDIPSLQFLHLSGRLPAEPLEMAVMSRLVRPGDVFVDVGAHWGMYVPHIFGRLGPTGRYMAIEPGPINISFLRKAFTRLGENFQIVQAAISDRSGTSYLHGDGTPGAFISSEQIDAVPVRVERLDSILLPLEEDRCVVMKIDTEGQEAAVIRGCKGLANAGIEPIFFLEYLPSIHGQSREDILDTVEATFGPRYTFWAIDQCAGDLRAFRRGDDLGKGVRNMLAIPAQREERLATIFER